MKATKLRNNSRKLHNTLQAMGREFRNEVRERLAKRTIYNPDTGCFESTRSPNGPLGYTQMWVESRKYLVHQVAWVLENGPYDDGDELCHLCRVPKCCNINHLEVMSRRDNQLKHVNGWPKRNAETSHCPAGHPYDKANAGYSTDKYTGSVRRYCRECKRIVHKALYWHQKEQDRKLDELLRNPEKS